MVGRLDLLLKEERKPKVKQPVVSVKGANCSILFSSFLASELAVISVLMLNSLKVYNMYWLN